MAKKTTTKTAAKPKATPIVDTPEVEASVEMNAPDIATIEEAIETVDTTINIEPEHTEEPLKVVEDMIEKIEEVKEMKEGLDAKLAAEPEKAEEILNKELERAKSIKKEAEKLINSVKNKSFGYNSTWNGISYDF